MKPKHPPPEELSEAPEREPKPSTSAAGGTRPPGRIGGGIADGDGDSEGPPPNRSPLGRPDRWYNLPIEDLDISMRAYNCLRRSGLMTVGQIVSQSEEELLGLRNFGRRSYEEVRQRIEDLGITWHPQAP